MDATNSQTVTALPNIMSVDDMWTLVRGSDSNWGIEGYEVPRKYYDYHQVKWEQERYKMLQKPKADWPPEKWKKDEETGKPIPPKRPNYLDQVIKWAHSYYDPKRAEEVKEALEQKGHPLDKKKRFLLKKMIKEKNILNMKKIKEKEKLKCLKFLSTNQKQ